MISTIDVLSSSVQRSLSDRDLLGMERRVTRTRLVSSSSSTNLLALAKNSSISKSSRARATTSHVLPWDRLGLWIYGIAVVNFDLELGHTIELILPNHCKLTDDQKKNLSYLAFPDTNAKCSGDMQYHFRLNHQSTLPTHDQFYNALVPPALHIDSNTLFGYVNFRQIRQKNLKRGYFQKSFVLLSKFPFFSLFLTLAKEFAIYYFDNGREQLERCFQRMDAQWPEPEPGESLRLTFDDHIYQIRIPTHGDKPFSSSDLIQFRSTLHDVNASATSNPNPTVKFPIDDDTEIDSPLNSFSSSEKSSNAEQQKASLIPFVYDVNTFQSLSGVLTHIQLLWELVLLNEPIAVFGNFPTNSSQTVQALVHIIWPLRYASDYRPYFTIHNSEFNQISHNDNASSSPLIIGVTNPIFSKLIVRWPHIIRLNDNSHDYFTKQKTENFLLVEHDQDDLCVNELESSLELSMSPPKPVISKKVSTHAKPLKFNGGTTSTASSLAFEIKAGLYTKYRPYLQRDKTILRKLQSTRSQQRPDTVQNALLRRFFLELTQTFIIPLERYFSSLLPLHKHYRPNRDPPALKKFNGEEFLKTLDLHGPQLTTGLKGDWKDLYKHFFRTENFRLWLKNREDEAKDKIFSIYIETIAHCRLEEDFRFSRLTEVEIVDLIIKFRDLIQCLESKDDRRVFHLDQRNRENYAEKLKLKMQFMIDQHLSNDMKLLFQ